LNFTGPPQLGHGGLAGSFTTRIVGALLVATTFAFVSASGAEAKKPVTVSCGETITSDTTLANDLTDCPQDGIVIGADDITLDLNGHTIDGTFAPEECPPGPPPPGCESNGVLSEGHEGVTVEGGSIQEFGSGVWLAEGAGHRLRQLSVSDNGDGIDVFAARDTVVTRNSADDNVFGIWVGFSDGITVKRNAVLGYQVLGVELARSERVLVAGNEVSDSDPGAPVAGEASGICVCFGSADNRIERNSVSGNGSVGVRVDLGEPHDNSITNNQISRNGFVGVLVEGDDNSVTNNRLSQNRDGMILAGNANAIRRNRVVDSTGANDGSGFGIVLETGQDNLIADNVIARAALIGIWMGIPEVEEPTVGTVLRHNQSRAAGTDGILVDSNAADTLLERNLAEDAGDDGIDVQVPATTLTKNTANNNHDLGIEAVSGVTDGGGNKASGNGNALQCTNVFCG
jgi:parallel beta-helix repeat protein